MTTNESTKNQTGTNQTGTTQGSTTRGGTAETDTTMGDTARRAAEELKETGREALHGAKSVMGNAMSDLKAASSAKADEMRGMVAEEGQRMASSLRDAAHQGGGGVQAKVLETMANGVSAMSDQLAQHDMRELMDDVTSYARRNPAIFVAGAAVAGLVLARLAAQAGRQAQEEMGATGHGAGGRQAGDMGAGRQSGGMGGGMGGRGASDAPPRGPVPGGPDLDPDTRGPSMGGNL